MLTTFGQPAGSFASTTVAFGTKSSAVAIEDFNNDLFRDLLVTDPVASTVVFRNQSATGNGTFDPPVSTPVGAQPVALAIGHLDGDATLDAVTANKAGNSASILIGNGDGTFAVTTVAMGLAPIGVAILDVDNDGVPDIATANSGDNTVTIFLRGTQTTVTVALGSGASPIGITTLGGALVVANAGDPGLIYISNTGTAIGVVERQDIGGVPSAVATASSDVNDVIAVAVSGPKQIAMVDAGNFVPQELGGGGNLFAWGHFESTDDLVVGSTTSTEVTIYRAIDGIAAPPEVVELGVVPTSITGGSLTTNLGDDLVITDTANNRVLVFPADPATGDFLTPIVIPTGAKPIATIIAPFNEGNRPDLAVLEQGANQIEIFELVGGTLTLAATLPTGASPSAFAVGVFTGVDFCSDLVVTNEGDNTFSEFLCTMDYTFTTEAARPAGTAPTGIAIGSSRARTRTSRSSTRRRAR